MIPSKNPGSEVWKDSLHLVFCKLMQTPHLPLLFIHLEQMFLSAFMWKFCFSPSKDNATVTQVLFSNIKGNKRNSLPMFALHMLSRQLPARNHYDVER